MVTVPPAASDLLGSGRLTVGATLASNTLTVTSAAVAGKPAPLTAWDSTAVSLVWSGSAAAVTVTVCG